MKPWLFLLMIFLNCKLIAQNITIFVQIDTLKYPDKYNSIYNFRYSVDDDYYLECLRYDSTEKVSDTYPNFTRKIQLDNDSSTIKLPIDIKGSYVILKNASDTLIINSWRIYGLQVLDSTSCVTEYYKKINGVNKKKPLKVKKKLYVTKPEPPPMIIVTINGISQKVSLKSEKSVEESDGHGGYKPKEYRDEEGNYKKKVTYYYIHCETIRYNWIGEIDLAKTTPHSK